VEPPGALRVRCRAREQLITDDTLLDDMASSILALRTYFSVLAEHDTAIDVRALDGLLERYETETGHKAEPWRS
jgi:hypothetical protein